MTQNIEIKDIGWPAYIALLFLLLALEITEYKPVLVEEFLGL